MSMPRINLLAAFKTEPSLFGKFLAIGILGIAVLILCLGGGILSLPFFSGGLMCLKDEFS
jgi:hypothetical protein